MKRFTAFFVLLFLVMSQSFAANNPLLKENPKTNCTANFGWHTSNGSCTDLTINFFLSTLATDITSLKWEFGDGQTSSVLNPSHTYSTIGTYNVCLYILCTNGYSDSICKNLVIYSTDSIQAEFSYFYDSINPYSIHFNNTSIGDFSYIIWEFDDGVGSTLISPVHVYQNPGVYEVKLVEYNPIGCYQNYKANVFVFGDDSCQALFYPIMDTSYMGLTVHFNDTSVGNQASYSWNFGDGQFSSLVNPTHTFSDYGLYVVCLTRTTATCQSTWCDSLYLFNPNYYNTFSDGNMMNHSFWGYAYNGVAPYTFQWDFGDGSSSSDENPQHMYVTPGGYWVSLTTTDANANVFTTSKLVLAGSSEEYITIHVKAGTDTIDAGKLLIYYHNPVNNTIEYYHTIDENNGAFVHGLSVCPGDYYFLAKPDYHTSYYSTYSPGYFQSSLTWANATPFIPGTQDTTLVISLIPITPGMTGNGSIGGTLTEGNKYSGQGLPVNNVEIMLLDLNDQLLGYCMTDVSGHFQFEALAYTTYKIYAEVIGLETFPVLVNLTADHPEVDNLILHKTQTSVIGINENPSISETVQLSCYPNPANTLLRIELNSDHTSSTLSQIFEISGKELIQQHHQLVQGKNTMNFDVSTLSPGLYFLVLTQENGQKLSVKLSIVR